METSQGPWVMRLYGVYDRWVRDADGRGLAEVNCIGPNPTADGLLMTAAPLLRDACLALLVASGSERDVAAKKARAALRECGL